uniref:V-type proton ATPase subunit E n=1 Tax=Chromera velia CCMP2878 TaxID=1169474 RepID=A0A0G4FEW6_9ALVE|mmetsp:Transcript_5849/g.11620  ORF Transcript_5849/g.11620 Transcript_5849/m.11620 type:complete len:232 (+) Transcript_5849:168-863(+)|eukprot:Cvel_16656.t1-p1 / transcript=Cvel_16656.t1 / gene=Cvel_16656 / organism=Chromera_velia_CCMP2878 / gene_product=V-type proton ATPase subunit E, putative / transcript_product=V-type proton ATPase subunit E, putative / location=Cvel_scaffold1292:6743-7435(-) / protein_length=231 / sequence_SO=supercontig / SO=protein_coding / is_pseudo=false
MDEGEAQRQIAQMVNFILNEAKDKAQEIEAKALEDFNIEKLKLVQQMKEKIRNEFQKKAKQVEVQRSIQRSTAVNRARLRKIEARNRVVEQVVKQASGELAKVTSDSGRYKSLMQSLLVQGLLKLLEDQVVVRCRECDKGVVQSVLDPAAKQYSEKVQQLAGVKKAVSLSIDTTYLPPAPTGNDAGRTCAGGLILLCHQGKISLDNTLDARLAQVAEECKPQVRSMLFPTK